LVACEALDLLSFAFEALGIEEFAVSETSFDKGLEILAPASVPWSHGLFMSILWSFTLAALAYLISKDKRTSGVIGAVVFSHWILDFIVHPGLPVLFNGSPLVGLSLWTSGPGFIASIILELVLLAAGIAIYLVSRTRKPSRV
jgi:hypothetical protein